VTSTDPRTLTYLLVCVDAVNYRSRAYKDTVVEEPNAAHFTPELMEAMTQWITEQLGISPNNQVKIFWTIVTIVGLGLLRTIVLRMVARNVDDVRARYRWTKGTRYATVVIGFLVLGRIWIGASSQLGTFLGLLSAGLAIALRDPIVNMAGWVYIVWKRPFAVGDRVEVPGHAGDVIDVGLIQFTLNEIGNWVDADQSTGRIIHRGGEPIYDLLPETLACGIHKSEG
jgi:small-conductance mechanosensitive channel